MASFMTIGLVAVLAATPTNGGSMDIKIVLKGDTRLYLSRIDRGKGINPIEVAKKLPDIHGEFEVFPNENYTYSFKADNDKYRSRMYRDGIDAIEAAKTSIDQFSKFTIITGTDADKIAIIADKVKYLSPLNRGSGVTGYNPVEASKNNIDFACKLTVASVMTAGRKKFSAPEWLDQRMLQ